MRSATVIVFGFLLAATPSFAAPVLQGRDAARETDEPRGDRWQGRHHWLYDDVAQDTAPEAATDGHAANARADCRTVPVRVKRSDGSTALRRINRCD